MELSLKRHAHFSELACLILFLSCPLLSCRFEALRCPQVGPTIAPRQPQDGPKTVQDGPKTAARWPQDGPKMVPSSTKMVPRCPKMPQDGPKIAKMAQDGRKMPGMTQDGPKMAPRWSQDGLRETPKLASRVGEVQILLNRLCCRGSALQEGPKWP